MACSYLFSWGCFDRSTMYNSIKRRLLLTMLLLLFSIFCFTISAISASSSPREDASSCSQLDSTPVIMSRPSCVWIALTPAEWVRLSKESKSAFAINYIATNRFQARRTTRQWRQSTAYTYRSVQHVRRQFHCRHWSVQILYIHRLNVYIYIFVFGANLVLTDANNV